MMAPSKTFMFGRRGRQTAINTYDLCSIIILTMYEIRATPTITTYISY